jgi:hypothetical protein
MGEALPSRSRRYLARRSVRGWWRSVCRFCVPLPARVANLLGVVGSVVTVTSDRLPVRAEPQISEDLRQRGIVVVKGLFVDGKVDQNAFEQGLDGLLAVHSEAEFASLMRSLPPPVAVTPPSRQRQEPLEIATSMGEVRLDGRWQVGRVTKIDTGMGAVIVDLTEAEFDDWEVEIVVHTRMGAITVISPPGLDIRLVGRNSPVTISLEPSIPGFPVVRLSATSDMGTIRVMNPTEQPPRRKRWRRRSDPTHRT